MRKPRCGALRMWPRVMCITSKCCYRLKIFHWRRAVSSRMPKLLVAAALFIVFPACVRAQQPGEQHHHEHPADSVERLDTISFPTSCSAEVQPQFERGVELLYSCEYDETTKQFEDVTKSDSGCAIAYWGEAMTLYHQLWGPPSESDLAEGWKLVEKEQA